MDKISSILPTNSRVQTVDTSNAPTLRPGTPTFGAAPVSAPSAADKVSFSKAAVESEALAPTPMTWKRKEEQQAQIAKSMSEGFFGKSPKAEPEVRVSNSAIQTVRNLGQQSERESLRPLAEARVQEFLDNSQEEEALENLSRYTPKGSQLSLKA